MDITGFSYLVFFVLVLAGHRLLQGRHEAQKLLLVAASYYFYATVDWRFCGLLLALTAINFVAGNAVARAPDAGAARRAITGAVVLSISLLCYFKYLNFFGEMVNSLSAWLGAGSLVPFVNILLPVGISFMTFQAITYPIDLYHRRLDKPCGVLDFAMFMAFFPRLLSGPIVTAAYFLPQLREPHPRVSREQGFEGLALIMRGIVKKVLLADTLGVCLVEPAFANPGGFSSPFLWLALFGYSFQVYLDLSGYTDMARGASTMLGYRLPVNFNRPYLATSIANFWQRWHITMSSFFRNYLYDPLAQSGVAPTYVNLLIVFVAIGLWHGAGWNFVVYGLLHGSMVALGHFRDEVRARKGKSAVVYRGHTLLLRVAFIFVVVVLTRLLFRSADLALATSYIEGLFVFRDGQFPVSVAGLLALGAAAALHFTPVQWRDQFMAYANTRPAWMFGAGFASMLYMVVAMTRGTGGFIYFQF
ncbi:MBOAT family O-acyltransferase [Massilia niastensis]|uniref:MBOAT family O-acyltransferase n=1 Tax=Massilia niastensis TaxID=544911 RepID=UPI000374077A|nr:MBOAT family O-acyltransferase [Massilia niastensis]